MVDIAKYEKRKMKGGKMGERGKEGWRKGEGKLATQNEKEDIRPYPTNVEN